MTSRQPGTAQPGTTSHEGTPGGGLRPALAQQRLLRLLPLALLIILGLAGLRGRMEQEAIRFSLRELGVPVVHWDGVQSLDLPLAGYTRRPLLARR